MCSWKQLIDYDIPDEKAKRPINNRKRQITVEQPKNMEVYDE